MRLITAVGETNEREASDREEQQMKSGTRIDGFYHGRLFGMCAAATVFVAAAASVQAAQQPVAETFGSSGPTAIERPGVVPPSFALNAGRAAFPQFRLGPIDTEALLLEDEINAIGRAQLPYRVGIERDVLLRGAEGQWSNVRGGHLWTLDVVSAEATGLRLHLIGMQLPDGAELYIYNPNNPANIDGPLTGAGRLDNGEMWSRTIWGDTARIEYFVPAQVVEGKLNREVPFVISEVSHWYRELGGNGRGGMDGCHNDVTCFPSWQNVANAGAVITFQDGGSFVCSGQLLDTQAQDLTPYFYTANHCINNQTVAQTSEVFWHFQSLVCGANGVLNESSVDVNIVAGNGTLDYSILLIDGEIPGNLFWVGWTTAIPGANSDAVGVHHPGGSWTRISFGRRLTGSVCGFGGSANYHRLTWTFGNDGGQGACQLGNGTWIIGTFLDCQNQGGTFFNGGITEGGSSGSAIYRADTQQAYGALFCGTTSNPCGNPTLDDDYGRFDRMYQSATVQTLLAAGSDDIHEPNDACASATTLSPGTYNNLVVKSTREDWYRIQLNAGDSLTATATFSDPDGDIDMQLFGSCPTGVALRNANSNTDNEAFTYPNTGGSGFFYIRVYMDETDTRADYSLTLAVSLANDNCGSNVPVVEGNNPFTTIGSTTGGPNAHANCNFPDNNLMQNDVWFRYIPTCTTQVTMSVCGADFQPRLQAFFISCPANDTVVPVGCDEGGCPDGARMTFNVQQGFAYQIRIASKNGVPGSGTLVIQCGTPATGACCMPDSSCAIDVEVDCDLLGGTYQGDATTCEPETCGAPCPADLTGAGDVPDGMVDVTDLFRLLANWNTNGQGADLASPFDLVDVGDLFVLLAAWGNCP